MGSPMSQWCCKEETSQYPQQVGATEWAGKKQGETQTLSHARCLSSKSKTCAQASRGSEAAVRQAGTRERANETITTA